MMCAEPAKFMRIMLLLRSLSVGGAERQASLLARHLAQRGHEVTVVVFYGGGALETELADSSVTVVSLGKTGRSDVVGFWNRLGELFEQQRPHALYSFLTVPNILAGMMQGRGAKIICGVRASDMAMEHYNWLGGLTHHIEPAFAQRADLIIANSSAGAAAATARGFPKSKVRVVHNGVELERFQRDPARRAQARGEWGVGGDELVIGHIARFDPMKDHETFLRAFAHVAAQRSDARAVVVTDAEKRLQAMVAAAGVSNRVHVAETEATIAMSGFDIFCSSSAFGEGFSNVLCEALAAGLPCAATNVGDARNLLGEAGFIAPPRSADLLAEAIVRAAAVANTPDASARAVARAARFTPERMATETEALIASLIAP